MEPMQEPRQELDWLDLGCDFELLITRIGDFLGLLRTAECNRYLQELVRRNLAFECLGIPYLPCE